MSDKLRKMIFGAAVAVSFISLALLVLVYRNSLASYENITLQNQLREMSMQSGLIVREKMHSAIRELELASKIFSDYEDLHSEEAMENLKEVSKTTDFVRLSLTKTDGYNKTEDGDVIYVGDSIVQINALSGNNDVSEIRPSKLTGKDVIVLAVPIYRDGEIVGAIAASYYASSFYKLIETDAFSQTGFSHIIQDDGRVFYLTNHENDFVEENQTMWEALQNVEFCDNYSYQEIMDNINAKESGYTRFRVNGDELNVYYAPIEFNDWYVVMTIPQSVIQYRYNAINSRIITLTSIAALLIVSLFVLYRIMDIRHKRAIEFERDIFMTATSMMSYYVCELDIKNKIVYAISTQINQKYGRPLVFKNVPDSIIEEGIVPAEYSKNLKEIFKSIFSGQKFASTILQLQKNEKVASWVRMFIKVVEQEGGKSERAIVIIEDIDAQVSKEQGLKDEIIQLQEVCDFIVKNEYSNLVLIDAEKNKIARRSESDQKIERRWRKFNGKINYPIDDIDERDVEKLKALEDVNSVIAKLDENGGSFVLTFRKYRKNDSENPDKSANDIDWIELKCTYIMNNVILILSRNVNDIMLAQAQSKKILEDAADKAEKASKAKSMFLSHMSHEMRTPMNAIIGMTELAKRKPDDSEKINYYIEKIEDASKLLLSLINNVLDMSAIENDKIKVAEQPFNLKSIIRSINTIFSEQCSQKQINFEALTDGIKHEAIVGDQLRLNQILLNLLSNAVKFTNEDGRIELKVVERKLLKRKSEFKFIVKDTGCGMNEDMLSRLYQPFEQESSETVRKHGGSGLGMSITKSLVEMMNGTIEVKSKPNIGTTFTVRIPFMLSDDYPDDILDDNEDYADFDDESGFLDKMILLAEDNDMNREIATEILQAEGFKITSAINGQEAVDIYAQSDAHTFSAILMDIQMPIMNGYEASKTIREMDRDDAKTIPIIAMTADAFDEDVREAMKFGMNAHIAKPIDVPKLFETLRKLI